MPLLDPEALNALRGLVDDGDGVDACATRTLAAEGHEPLDGRRVAFEHRLDGSVRPVAHPACDAVPLGQPPHRVAKEDALDEPAHDNPATDHRGMMTVRPVTLVADLAAAEIGATFNFYRDGGRAALLRERLGDYLGRRAGACILLVGEAAGYRGARISGLPFTSERQVTGAGPAEATATIVGRTLRELGVEEDVLLWNLVPTHPHRCGQPRTNRPPTRVEIRAARPFLERLAQGRRIVPVGRLAERELGLPGVRHPSHGGAAGFRAALADTLGR